MKQDINTYRLTGETEPSDELLTELMHEVAIEAKMNADKLDQQLQAQLKNEIAEAMKRVSQSS